jgi:hypothetical protein
MFANLWKRVVGDEDSDLPETVCAPPEARATGLIRLPMEIRLQIYYYCIPRQRVIPVMLPSGALQYGYELDFGAAEDYKPEADSEKEMWKQE